MTQNVIDVARLSDKQIKVLQKLLEYPAEMTFTVLQLAVRNADNIRNLSQALSQVPA